MPAEVSQPPTLPPGFALVTVKEAPEFDPATLAFSVENPPRGFLQEAIDPPWGTTHAWLRPASAIMGPQGLELTLGPERTWFMRPNVTYVLRLRDAGRPTPLVQRIAWKGIRMPSDPPQALPEPSAKPVEEAIVAPASTVLKVEEAIPVSEQIVAEPIVVEPPKPKVEVEPKAKSKRFAVFISIGLLCLIGAAAAAWFLLPGHHEPNVVVTPEPAKPNLPLDPASARAFLQTNPGPDASYAESQRYQTDGSPGALQGALILLSRAADSGSGPAQTALGRMYDPDTFSPQTSAMKAADPDKALLWYQRAAKSNDPEGLYRLGKLLISGRAAAPGLGPEQGAADLQRAADLGSNAAREEIDKLRNKPN
jgi:hypothetical protein